MSVTTTHQPVTSPNEAACRSLFGKAPEDVVMPIKCAGDALAWIDEIFKTIIKEALIECNGHRIKRLAEAGEYLAADLGNYVDCEYETMIDSLRSAGVVDHEKR